MTTATAGGILFVLASASPRRQELMGALGLRLQVDPGTIPEPERKPGETAMSYVIRAAKGKAREVVARHDSGLIIGADTIVLADNRILGKPASTREAASMLRELSGRWHEVHTGVHLIDVASGRTRSGHSRSRVHFKRLDRGEIDWYLSTGEHRDKAGAYAIQGYGSLFIDRIEGCYFNIVGFPIFTFARLCRGLGIRLPQEMRAAAGGAGRPSPASSRKMP